MLARHHHWVAHPPSGLLVVGLVAAVSARIESHHKLVSVEQRVQDSYIVLFEDGKTTESLQRGPLFEESFVQFQYDAVLNGVALKGVPDDAMMEILESEDVKMVYEDGVVQLDPEESMYGRSYGQEASQIDAVWGLDRIDSRIGLDQVYNYDYTGAGVTIFVADSGVLGTHSEFSNRHIGCMDFTGEGCGVPGDHGTHVAGTAMGTTYGVAKAAEMFDIKVLDVNGDGEWSWIIAGFNYVASMKRDNPNAKYVLNASLGGPYYFPMNQAAADLVDTGVVVVLSAGNDGIDACTRSPGSTSSAITVGATMNTDARSVHWWWESNWGTCLDIFAPGSDILSASNTGGTTVKYGTSMATPHVAGIAALLLEQDLDPYTELTNMATRGVLTDVGNGSPNLLAFDGFSGDVSTPPPTPAPTDAECSDDEVVFTLDLTTDLYGGDTSWELINDCTGATVLSGGNYPNGAVVSYSEDYCVTDAQQYTFTINDSYGDGICCNYGDGSYAIYHDGSQVGSGDEFGADASHTYGSCPTPSPTASPTTSPTTSPTSTCPECHGNRYLVRSCKWKQSSSTWSCDEYREDDDDDASSDDTCTFLSGGWDCSSCNHIGGGTRCCRNCEYHCTLCDDGVCNGADRCLYESCARGDDGLFYCGVAKQGDLDGTCGLNFGTWRCEMCNGRNKPQNQACCRDCTQIA